MVDVRRETEHAVPRIVVIRQEALGLLDLDAGDATQADQLTRSLGARVAAATPDFAVATERRFDARARPQAERQARQEKEQIEWIKMQHALNHKPAVWSDKGGAP